MLNARQRRAFASPFALVALIPARTLLARGCVCVCVCVLFVCSEVRLHKKTDSLPVLMCHEICHERFLLNRSRSSFKGFYILGAFT